MEEGFDEKTLGADFYAKAAKSKNRFLREYFDFDARLRNMKVSYLAKRLGKKAEDYFVEMPEADFEEEKQIIEVLANADFVDREQRMDELKWDLSPYYIEKRMEGESNMPENKRGMGATLLRLIQKYGIVGYDAMRSVDTPAPKYVFMAGAEYTAQEFARSVCKPDEYIALTANDEEPYYQEVGIELPDNWLHDRFYNIPIDSLLAKTERAVRQHHGVCWESKGHAMAIVGIAHDEEGNPYFIMKNSWGTNGPYKGLAYLSFKRFRKQTLAVEMTKEAYNETTNYTNYTN